MEPSDNQIEILLAEDDPGDIKLLQECLDDVKFPYHLSIASDGEAVLAFLARQAPYTEAPTPGLILLDIYLPQKGVSALFLQIHTVTKKATEGGILTMRFHESFIQAFRVP